MDTTNIAAAVRGLVRALAVAPHLRDDIMPSLQILTEWQATAPIGSRLEQFSRIYASLSELPAGDRMRAVRERLGGISKTRYYELLQQLRRVRESPVADGIPGGEDHEP